jgi:hypothetical protein
LSKAKATETFVGMSVPIRVGEVCYNFRSALDYLIFELAKLDSGVEQGGTQFPIMDSPKDFTAAAMHPGDGPAADSNEEGQHANTARRPPNPRSRRGNHRLHKVGSRLRRKAIRYRILAASKIAPLGCVWLITK